MSITIDAIYESGTLRLAQPLSELKERTKVRLTIEAADESSQSGSNQLASILERIDRRRAAIYQRCGELEDSAVLIREGRERELE
ncbi:MAG: antitoxin family protein [Blastocatellia bacterium]